MKDKSSLRLLDYDYVKNLVQKSRVKLEEITEIDGYSKEHSLKEHLPTKSGRAVSVNHAARCLHDVNRTARFIKSLSKAILLKLVHKDKIKVLYIGCGPYAPFLSLIADYFPSKRLEFTLVEINPIAATNAQKVIDGLGISAYVNQLIVGDALTSTENIGTDYDIFITETMNRVIIDEPYIPIVRRFKELLPEDCIFIPENAKVFVEAVKIADIGKIHNLTEPDFHYKAQYIGELYDSEDLIDCNGDWEIFINVDDIDLTENDYLVLHTEVVVDKDHILSPNECSLTIPYIVEIPKNKPIKNIVFHYKEEEHITLNIKFE